MNIGHTIIIKQKRVKNSKKYKQKVDTTDRQKINKKETRAHKTEERIANTFKRR